MSASIEVKEVERLNLKKGDILVIRVPHVLSSAEIEYIDGAAKSIVDRAKLDFEVPIMVLGEGMKLQILTVSMND